MNNKSERNKLNDLFKKETITKEEYEYIIDSNLMGKNSLEIEKSEEKIGKKITIDMYINKFEAIENLTIGKLSTIIELHKLYFNSIHLYAGKIRNITYQKNGIAFLPHRYIKSGVEYFNQLPFSNLEEIIRKYVEYNFIHPFYEGNGRVGRVWLDALIFRELKFVISWENISSQKYLRIMHDTRIDPQNYKELLNLIKINLITLDKSNFKTIFRGTDLSYSYEGLSNYKTNKLYEEVKKQ